MFVDESDDAGDTSATIVLSKLLATNDDIFTSTEYTWLMDMVNYTLQVTMMWLIMQSYVQHDMFHSLHQQIFLVSPHFPTIELKPEPVQREIGWALIDVIRKGSLQKK